MSSIKSIYFNLTEAIGEDLVQGRSILELGAGVGLVGVILATIQAVHPSTLGRICLTDINDEVLERCQRNILLPCSKF